MGGGKAGEYTAAAMGWEIKPGGGDVLAKPSKLIKAGVCIISNL
jgi:hypothetical protein